MHQSSPLDVGRDVHQESITVAYVAKDHDAEVISLGTFGTRQCDRDTRIRKLPSKAKHVILVDEAGPCGAWRYRDLTKKDAVGWVVAPWRGVNRAAGPKPGIPMRVVSWSKAPGHTGIRPTSVDTSNGAWKSSLQRSRPSVGRPKSGAVSGIASSWPKANRPIRSSSPWPEH